MPATITKDVIDDIIITQLQAVLGLQWMPNVRNGVEQGIEEYIDSQTLHIPYSLTLSTAIGAGWVIGGPRIMASSTMSLAQSVLSAGTGWADHFQDQYNASLKNPDSPPGDLINLKNQLIQKLQAQPTRFATSDKSLWLREPIREYLYGEFHSGRLDGRTAIRKAVTDVLAGLTKGGKKVIPTNRSELIASTKASVLNEANRWQMIQEHSHRARFLSIARVRGTHVHNTTFEPKITLVDGAQKYIANEKLMDWMLHNSWRLQILDSSHSYKAGWGNTQVKQGLKVCIDRGGRTTIPDPVTNGNRDINIGEQGAARPPRITVQDVRLAVGQTQAA